MTSKGWTRAAASLAAAIPAAAITLFSGTAVLAVAPLLVLLGAGLICRASPTRWAGEGVVAGSLGVVVGVIANRLRAGA